MSKGANAKRRSGVDSSPVPASFNSVADAPDGLLSLYGVALSSTEVAAALERAHDTRKFEIDLYWKRATYFWTFIAAAFAGYFILVKENVSADLRFVASCLGFAFSLAWYCANRGSKFWQLNWETHVDVLENSVTGPLYKTILQPKQFRLWHLTEPYSFSVSRINTALSLYVAAIWVFLASYSATEAFEKAEPLPGFNIGILTVLTIVFVIVFSWRGKSDLDKPKDRLLVRRRIRVRLVTAEDA